MSDVAIRVDGLGKRYRIGAVGPAYQTLRDQIGRALTAPLRALRREPTGKSREFWALRDVSFEVKRGEVVGVIGRNGAGKSTLLKILSRITEPTTGAVDLYGRVGSLLEVGTGFHAELTGRENVFLNGAILGMKRSEIASKFDEIVAFAEVEQFIDTPVKHYSSGMYMRLAFAVAAHLEPEILVVDEVLAVGDAAFQKKCLGKMGDVARDGRTVLFVSHHMAAVSHLCRSSVLLENGKLHFHGDVREGVDRYLRQARLGQRAEGDGPHVLYRRPAAAEPDSGDDEGFVTAVEFLDTDGEPRPEVCTWDALIIRIHFRVIRPVKNLHVVFQIADAHGTKLAVLTTSTHLHSTEVCRVDGHADCRIPRLPLAAGTFQLGAGLCVPHRKVIAFQDDLALFTVHPADVYGCGSAPAMPHARIAFEHDWSVTRNRDGENG
jgi:lipopolysaccharide transport system ATP-binding protein